MSPGLLAEVTTVPTFMPARRESSANMAITAGGKHSRGTFFSKRLTKRSFGGLPCGFT